MHVPRGPFLLGSEPVFPSPEQADPAGLLAVGGELTPAWLLEAYRRGIFPWPLEEEGPMLWWSPDPRFVLYPDRLHVSASLEQRVRSGRFDVRFDAAFRDVVRGCADSPRDGDSGTWITPEIQEAYERLHALGFAHSAESRREGRLVGGLYGVALGAAFFGESMFHRESDASKVALVALVRQLRRWGFAFVDCQMRTGHLARLGGAAIPRARYLRELAEALRAPGRIGPWTPDP